MADPHPYHFGSQGDPNPAHLDRYFAAIPDDAEALAFREALEADEFMNAAFGSLSAAEYALVKDIASSVNTRITQLTSPPSLWKRYLFPLLLLLALLIVLLISILPANQDAPAAYAVQTPVSQEHSAPSAQKQAVPNPAPAAATASGKPDPAPVSVQVAPIPEKEKATETEPATTTPEPEDEPAEAPSPVRTHSSGESGKTPETSRDFANDHQAMLLLRVGNAQVMSKLNLAEAESVPSDSRRAVNDPNIGSPTVTSTRQVSYKIEDMPSYTGGDQGLTSYIQRQLSSRISLPRSQAIQSVVVRFEVNGRGKVSNVSVLDEVPEAVEKEIVQVISTAPGWQPGKKSGKKGSLQYMVFISFY